MVIGEQSQGVVGKIGNWKNEKPIMEPTKNILKCIIVSLYLSAAIFLHSRVRESIMALKISTHFAEAAKMFLFVTWGSKYLPAFVNTRVLGFK